jgi:hypothetical protein
MPRRHNTAVTNETKHPYIVEVAAVKDGLDVELSRRIMQFHKSQHIQPRYGRRLTTKRGEVFYRWCFSDLLIARAFAEQFNGEFYKPSVGSG